MLKLPNIFNSKTKCARCSKPWPMKEAYYDKKGNTFCTMECVRAQQMDIGDNFHVAKGEKPA